jgi:hypothetical protein
VKLNDLPIVTKMMDGLQMMGKIGGQIADCEKQMADSK